MILVAPFCIKDCRSALKNIKWAGELDGKSPFEIILSYDTDVPIDLVGEIDTAARAAFSQVHHFRYSEWRGKPTWPNPQNYAFQCLCWEIINKYKKPFLFWEPDAIPLRSRWAEDIEHEYLSCGKPFMGHVVHGACSPNSMHLNGVAVYPPNLNTYSTAIMIPPENMAWDVAGSIDGVLQNARHTSLISNVWMMDKDGLPSQHGVKVPTFPDQDAVDRAVDFDTQALFHRNKDMTLVDRLRERRNAQRS